MKKLLLLLILSIALPPLLSSFGCGSNKETTPQKSEEFRKQHIERAKHMRKEG